MSNVSTPIEIPLSKRNLAFMLLGAAGFVIMGLFLIFMPETGGLFSGRAVMVRIVGVIGVLFFGVIGVLIYRRFNDPRIGLSIDATGLTDHSSGVSVGRIEWSDITGIDTTRVGTEPFLLLLTDQPEKYIDRASNRLQRSAIRANHRMTGTPLNLSARTLEISFEELVATVTAAWERYRNA